MTDAVTPPNPVGSERKNGPDPTLLTIDALRREIAMLSSQVTTQLDAAEKLRNEKFASQDQMMDKAEEQRLEQKMDTKSVVDAALSSQKEATSKMEKSISDQLASLRTNFDTSLTAVQGNVAGLKERLTILESIKQGQVEQKTEARQVTSGTYAAIGIGISILLALLTLIGFVVGGGLT